VSKSAGQREDYSKQRDPQSRKTFSVWWHCEHACCTTKSPLEVERRDRLPEQGDFCLYVSLSVCFSICLCIYLSVLCLSVSLCLSICLFSVCLFLSVCFSICLFSVSLSVSLPLCGDAIDRLTDRPVCLPCLSNFVNALCQQTYI